MTQLRRCFIYFFPPDVSYTGQWASFNKRVCMEHACKLACMEASKKARKNISTLSGGRSIEIKFCIETKSEEDTRRGHHDGGKNSSGFLYSVPPAWSCCGFASKAWRKSTYGNNCLNRVFTWGPVPRSINSCPNSDHFDFGLRVSCTAHNEERERIGKYFSMCIKSWTGVHKSFKMGAAAYQLRNTSSRTITEVKQRCAQLVLGWETVQKLSWVLLLTLKVG